MKRQHTQHKSGRCFATREANVFTARFLELRTQKVGRGSSVNMRTARLLSLRTRKVAMGLNNCIRSTAHTKDDEGRLPSW